MSRLAQTWTCGSFETKCVLWYPSNSHDDSILDSMYKQCNSHHYIIMVVMLVKMIIKQTTIFNLHIFMD